MKSTTLLCLTLLILPMLASRADAVTVSGSLFDTGLGTTVDIVPFTATGGPVTIDVRSWEFADAPPPFGAPVDVNGDGEFAFFDPRIYLFNDDGVLDAGDLVADNDDNLLFPAVGAADGSVSLVDSYLDLALPAGDYLLAIGAGGTFTVADAIAGFDDDPFKLFTVVSDPFVGDIPFPGHGHGDYQVTITISDVVPVPEPGAGLLLLIGLGAAGLARRRSVRC